MKILLAIDGSAPALAAVRHALQCVAEGLRASFVLANVQEPPSLYEVVVVHDEAGINKLRQDAGAELLQPAEALLEAAGLDYESEVAGGDPSHLLVDLVENYGCDALMMGARGVGDPHGSGLGTVTQALLQHSPVPVTVVRLPADEADEAADAAAAAATADA